MSCAYDELYLPLAQRMLGDMYDYAVNTLNILLEEFQKMFLASGLDRQIAMGNPTYIAGKNGCEVAREAVWLSTGEKPETEDIMYVDKSPEYWIGWSLAYYQWSSGRPFKNIEEVFPVTEMYHLYDTLHEADILLFVETIDRRFALVGEMSRLRRLRKYAELTQRELADRSGIPLRQIQLFEQGQRDIRKSQAQTLAQLSKTLGCSIEELIQ